MENSGDLDEKAFLGMSRRDFLLGLSASGIDTWVASSAKASVPYNEPTQSGSGFNIGEKLRVKPVLMYEIYKRKPKTSWKHWGGVYTQSGVDDEVKRINKELKKLQASAEFGLEIQPLVEVTDDASANAVKESDCDAILIYAAGSNRPGRVWLETMFSSEKPIIIFLRHKSGPVYLWYEIVRPRFFRSGNNYRDFKLDIWDVVVDRYDEVLWRLRALYGLKNTLGMRIVAINGAGGWTGWEEKLGPTTARKIWKLDIREFTNDDLVAMLQQYRADPAKVAQAERQMEEYLGGKGIVSVETSKEFIFNSFILRNVMKEIMKRADAPAITILHCMTIGPLVDTTACLPFSLINDEGLMAFCESDFIVIPSGILLRHISGKPVFLNDPTYPHDGVTTCAHCSAPRRMNGKDLEPLRILTHCESDYGAAPKVEFSKGQVITNLIPSFSSDKWVGVRGVIKDAPFYEICRSQIDVEIDGNWKKLLEDMRGFHWMTCYGDYLREVEYVLKKVGIKWQDISA